MVKLTGSSKFWIGGGLLLLLIATRGHHFNSPVNLGDATLAVFFLTALLFGGWVVFPLLIVAAGVVDYSAIHFGGVSDWCVTPGYLMLIPTYATLWGAGLLARHFSWSGRGALQAGLLITGATVTAFAVSNAGFYLFSNYFNDMSLIEYASRVSRYLPGYLAYTLLYSTVGLGLGALLQSGAESRPNASAQN
ncbi:MAG: hypothetical protein J4A00_01205 [Gammaproteobacteria bacterium]|nr:hypothetical protein [Gammaproteobacteria bacterium]